jgi:hypothetical protein
MPEPMLPRPRKAMSMDIPPVADHRVEGEPRQNAVRFVLSHPCDRMRVARVGHGGFKLQVE